VYDHGLLCSTSCLSAVCHHYWVYRGVVVNFDLWEPFPRPRSQLSGSRGVTPGKIFEIFDAKCRIWGQFGPENKLIEGQPNEYDVICWNASVLEFHLWLTIFAGVPFRLQNICRNSVPPRSRTITPLWVCICMYIWLAVILTSILY